MHQSAVWHFSFVFVAALALACKGRGPGLSQAAGAAPSSPPSLRALMAAAESREEGAYFIPTPLIRQSRNYTCGAASLQSVLMYWGDEFREAQLQTTLKSDPNNGTAYKAMINFVRSLNDRQRSEAAFVMLGDDETPDEPAAQLTDAANRRRQIIVKRYPPRRAGDYGIELREGKATQMRTVDGEPVPLDGSTLGEMQQYLAQGWPVIVLVQAWSGSENPVYDDDWTNGHYVVVNGMDQQNVYMMDPSTTGNYAFVPKSEFLRRWHDVDSVRDPQSGVTTDTKVRHFTLAIYKDGGHFGFDQILKMD